jgi:hypothetical protein
VALEDRNATKNQKSAMESFLIAAFYKNHLSIALITLEIKYSIL